MTETNKNKFCVLWQRKPLFTGTEDMGLRPDSFKHEKSLERFKKRIKTWATDKSVRYISVEQDLFKLFRCHL